MSGIKAHSFHESWLLFVPHYDQTPFNEEKENKNTWLLVDELHILSSISVCMYAGPN